MLFTQADSLEEAINLVNRNKYVPILSYLEHPYNFYLLKHCVFMLYFNLISPNRYSSGASIFTTSAAAASKFQSEIEAGQVGQHFLACPFSGSTNSTDALKLFRPLTA